MNNNLVFDVKFGTVVIRRSLRDALLEVANAVDPDQFHYKDVCDRVREAADAVEWATPNDAGPATRDEPMPKGEGREIFPLLVADIQERMEYGIRTYGESLRAYNGRDALVDAYQEALDLAVFLRQAIEERDNPCG